MIIMTARVLPRSFQIIGCNRRSHKEREEIEEIKAQPKILQANTSNSTLGIWPDRERRWKFTWLIEKKMDHGDGEMPFHVLLLKHLSILLLFLFGEGYDHLSISLFTLIICLLYLSPRAIHSFNSTLAFNFPSKDFCINLSWNGLGGSGTHDLS